MGAKAFMDLRKKDLTISLSSNSSAVFGSSVCKRHNKHETCLLRKSHTQTIANLIKATFSNMNATKHGRILNGYGF